MDVEPLEKLFGQLRDTVATIQHEHESIDRLAKRQDELEVTTVDMKQEVQKRDGSIETLQAEVEHLQRCILGERSVAQSEQVNVKHDVEPHSLNGSVVRIESSSSEARQGSRGSWQDGKAIPTDVALRLAKGHGLPPRSLLPQPQRHSRLLTWRRAILLTHRPRPVSTGLHRF